MCMSPDIYEQKLWGNQKMLRLLLADQPLPTPYQKKTSAEISLRTRIGFMGEVSVLIESYADIIIETEKDSAHYKRLGNELGETAKEFQRLSEHFGKASKIAADLRGMSLDQSDLLRLAELRPIE